MTENESIHRLSYEGKEILLIGTAHVSRESVDLVARVIDEERPDTVCVELCQSRYQAITQEQQWQNMDLFKVIREKRAFLLLSNLILSAFQRKIGQQLGVKPGEEMLRAIQSAEAIGARVELVDRDIRTTLSRAWRIMGLWTKVKLLSELLVSFTGSDEIKAEDIEKIKQKDALEVLLAEVGSSMPELRQVLIDERDQVLAEGIRRAPGQKIVAVVGAGHVPGIERYWNTPVDLDALNRVPPKGKWMSAMGWLLPLLIVVMVVVGFLFAGKTAGAQMIQWWILATGILAAVGAAAALGHPLTVLSAFVAAPIAALHPLIAAGWVSGLVEAMVRKPKVKDFEALPEDIGSVRGFWRNKITRILLVVVLTNLGSATGAFVAIPLMVKAFG